MRFAFATLYDLCDVRRGSGTFFHMSREIEKHGHTIHYIGPIDYEYPPLSRILRALHTRIGKRYLTFLDPFVGRNTGQQVKNALKIANADLLLTNDFAIAAFTETNLPIVIYTDAMITHDYQERNLPESRVANLSPISLALSRHTIRVGLRKADLCVFPARWSADEAIHYGANPKKIAIIPFGANIADPGSDVATQRNFDKIIQKGCLDLLFVGKDWARKGGDVAVAVVKELNRRGKQAKLHIVGSYPPDGFSSNFIHSYGLLDKSVSEDLKVLDQLYRQCDIFLLPSSSEGYVIAVLEAAAYGLPVLSYDTIGVTTAVIDGLTGKLFNLGAPANTFVDEIEELYRQHGLYSQLALGARVHYEETANWCTSTKKLICTITSMGLVH